MTALRVDELDLRIVRALLTGGHGALQGSRVASVAVADALGVHRNTVLRRIKRLADAKVFLPPILSVDPGVVGHVGGQLRLDAAPARRSAKVRERLLDVDGVAAVWELLDGWEVVVHARDGRDLDAKAARLARAAGAAASSWTVRGSDRPPRDALPLSELDVALLGELLPDARRSFAELAERLGRSVRTIERRYARLEKAGAVYLVPNDFASVRGLSLAFVSAPLPATRAARAKAVRAFLAAFPNAFLAHTEGDREAHALVYSPSLSEIEAQAREAERGLGAPVRVRVLLGQWFNPRLPAYLAAALKPARAGSRRALSR